MTWGWALELLIHIRSTWPGFGMPASQMIWYTISLPVNMKTKIQLTDSRSDRIIDNHISVSEATT